MARDSILPIVTHAHPKEGRRSVQFTVDLSNLSAVVDLVAPAMMGQISQICTLFFDNADNAFAVTIVMEGTLQRIVCPPNSQGYVRLLLPQKPRLGFSSPQACQYKINLLNWEVPEADIWTVGGTTVAKAPTVTKLTTVGAGNYSPPALCTRIEVEFKGSGAGGSGTGTAGGPVGGAAGSDCIFNGYHAAGAPTGGPNNFPAPGGANGADGAGAAWTTSVPGQPGCPISLVPWSATTYAMYGGNGGGNGAGRTGINVTAALAAQPNSGAGGGGGGFGPDTLGNLAANLSYGGGGPEGERRIICFNNPVGPYAYTIPDGGNGGPAGTGGQAGAKGGSGFITIKEFYN